MAKNNKKTSAKATQRKERYPADTRFKPFEGPPPGAAGKISGPVRMKMEAQAKIRKDVELAMKTGHYEPKLTGHLKEWWEKVKAHNEKLKKHKGRKR